MSVNASRRQLEAVLPRRGVASSAVSGSPAVSPGTALARTSLGFAELKVLELSFVVTDETLYKAAFKLGKRTIRVEYTTGIGALAADITAAFTSALNTAFDDQVGDSVDVTDTAPTVTLTSEVNGLDFGLATATANISAAVTTPLTEIHSDIIKLWVVNEGSNNMYITQDGNLIGVVTSGQVFVEYVDPWGGDFAVIGDGADTFQAFVTVPFNNYAPFGV